MARSWHRVVVTEGNRTSTTQRYETPKSALKRAEELGGKVQHRDHRDNWVDGPAQ